MDVVIYARVSTQRQNLEGMSIPAQLDRLRSWASGSGHTVIGEFVDGGISGTSMEGRAGIAAALDLVTRKRGALAVVSLSRAARNTLDALAMGERLQKAGGRLISLTEGLDSSNATGRLIWTLLSAVHTWVAEVQAEQTAATLGHMRRQRKRISGVLPFGFDLGPDGSSLVPNFDEQSALDLMRDHREAGESYQCIATTLMALQIRAKSGSARWKGKTVAAILKREEALNRWPASTTRPEANRLSSAQGA